MHNDNYTDFDLELKRMLQEAEEQVPSRVWDAVSGELDRRDRRKVVALRWRRAAYVAAAAAVLSGIFVFIGREGSQEPVRTAVVQKEVQRTDVPQADAIQDIEEQIAASSGAALAAVPEPDVQRPAANVTVPSAVSPAPVSVPAEDEPVREEAAVQEVPEQQAVDASVQEKAEAVTEPAVRPVEHKDDAPAVTFNPADPFAWEDEDVASTGWTDRASLVVSGNAMTNDFSGTNVRMLRTPASGVKSRTGIEEKGASSYAIPLSFGVGVRFNFSERWSVGTGLNWSLLSRTFNGTYTEVNSAGDIVRSINSEIVHDIHYVGIPLNTYFNILDSKNLRFYVWAGGSAERAISNRYRIKCDAGDIFYREGVKGIQLSAAGGLGLEFLIGKHFGLYLDPSARYYFDCGQPSSIRTKRPFMLNYEVGVRFNL